ncbi:fungal-specific transcription factor domain-containing protein [Auriculariales sp. MPI-PUGE-AT-0066]|nr:fungal-specific transcription factor domain-containing protein [Auriculariales sp. MPI-PUGE-AT-0066]
MYKHKADSMSVTASKARPCDSCRRGKRRCDGPEQSDRVCSRCKQLHKACSYFDPSERPRSVRESYIDAVEARLRTVEDLLQQRVPEVLLMQELGSLAMSITPASTLRPRPEGDEVLAELPTSETWELVAMTYQQHRPNSPDHRGMSHASQTTIRRPAFWRTPDHEFQGERPEERNVDPTLPPPDQLASLVHAYFANWSANFPIFHRPLFEQQLLRAEFAQNQRFRVAVLLVCALGESRLAEDTGGTQHSQHRPGWKFFHQAEPFLRAPTPAEPQLLDLQIFFLASLYASIILGNSSAWTVFGMGIRLAHLANAHRREKYKNPKPNLLDELWKRTFWSYVAADRMTAASYGRPLIIKDESFDLDLPLEADDACWDIEDDEYPFLGTIRAEQSSCSFFVAHIKQMLILGFSIQTIYSLNRSRLLMGFVGHDWEQKITTETDQLLDEWAATLPNHLQWNPDEADLTRFVHSAFLSARHHTLRISAHNPFVRATAQKFAQAPRSSRSANDLTASLANCTAAAVAGTLRQVGWADPSFSCGLVLLINLFGFRSSLNEQEILRYMSLVHICLQALEVVSVNHPMAKQRRPPTHSTLHWPENQTVPISPNSDLPFLPTEKPAFAHTNDPALSQQAQPAEQQQTDNPFLRTPSPFCLEAIPIELQNQMTSGLRHPIRIYPPLPAEHA